MGTERIKDIAARAAAYELINLFAIEKPEEIVVEDIAMARGVLVIEDQLDGAEARLIRKGNRGIIRVKTDITEIGRKRFAVAHDLGHWELHQDISRVNLFSESDVEINNSDPIEIEANIFASELLMPTKLIRSRCEEAYPNLQFIKDIANEFAVSLTCAALRFIDETNYSCAIVLSENGKILWWKKSRRCENVWFERKQKLHEDSLAWQCLKGVIVPEEGEDVPAAAWFQNESLNDKDVVFEQTINLGRYSRALSLLFIS